jgi:hypothetical protein
VSSPLPLDIDATRLCTTVVDLLCLSGPSDPRGSVAALRAALAPVATGDVTSTCFTVPIPNSPDSCHLEVPVDGSRLSVDVFSRRQGRSVGTSSYSGSMIELRVADRD